VQPPNTYTRVTDCICRSLYQVTALTLKTAVEAACMLLRIDNVVSGIAKSKTAAAGGGGHDEAEVPPEMQE